METIEVTHFSDALCVWAYVSQIRLDELRQHFGAQVAIECRFCSVFGDTQGKFGKAWSDRGGMRGYGAHVQTVVERFDHVAVHPYVWAVNPPASSMASHLFLCAIRIYERATPEHAGAFDRACWALRQAFFRDNRDVSQRQVQLEIAEALGLPPAEIENRLNSGLAHAELSSDSVMAGDLGVDVSPSFIMNGGRQRLIGNVGYRVIEANVRELLSNPSGQASWC